MRIVKSLWLLLISCLFAVSAFAQMTADPTTWTFEAKKKGNNNYDLIFHLKLQPHWHIWSFNPGGDGSLISPSFTFDKTGTLKLDGKTKEKGKLITEDNPAVGIVHMYLNQVDYIQSVAVTGNGKITGKYKYQVCDTEKCLAAKTKPFSFDIIDAVAVAGADTPKTAVTAPPADTSKPSMSASKTNADVAPVDGPKKVSIEKPKQGSLLSLFFGALIGGILAVLTPCVYSMIPITVSFFTKRSKTRAEGIRNAIYYSLSIIIIFTVLGILISAIFGGNALNNLSTNWIANLFFFAVFVIFGISFLGAFEIQLPSSWTSKTDSKAGVGSFAGIFFMALTLVIVSFSCTGPIIGPLLVIAGRGGITGPAIGMFGFSVGLALPFALFAVFPGMLNKIASSGGWLNQVKVTLGFIEMMLALKFLSNADLARGWRLLDREVFIAIWIVLAVLLGVYLLGKLKLSHDDAPAKNIYGQEYVSLFKLFLAIGCFSFAVYLLPGMWGAPLNAMSQFVPPMGTQDFVLGAGGGNGAAVETGGDKPVKYVDVLKIYEPEVVRKFGLVTYYDYDEAVAASKKLKKPIMLDFTGINCVNCRKMEGQVWSNPEVMKRLKEDFVIASLYCDYDKLDLPKSEQHFSQALQSDVVTLGDKNEDLQATKFNSNSQPFYFYVDENGNKLADSGYSYNPDVQRFINHLERVKEKYKQTHS
ncbi:MAG: thioredoxin family protein [Bacteroidetes bacterium]|nr:thioredoxin family protein [Bacteroidota bacterium]